MLNFVGEIIMVVSEISDSGLDHEPMKVLLVDDYAENRSVLEFVLRRLNVTCIQAENGDQALEQCGLHEFGLIYLDYHMPGKNGFDTAKLIQQIAKNDQTPIIFLTADTESEGLEKTGYEIGAMDFIYKPMDPEYIREKVQALVERARMASR